MSSSINTLIGTFSAIGAITNRSIDASNLICIDTQNNRIGINNINPTHSLTITNSSSGNDPVIGISTPMLHLDVTKLPNNSSGLTSGQVFYETEPGGVVGILKVKL
jgi:hypothetical protein